MGMRQGLACRSIGRQVGILVATGLIALGAMTGPASAENCREAVSRLAQQYDLSINPPAAEPAPGAGSPEGVSPNDLAKSGGVIEPPSTSDPATIEPPGDVGRAMPTVPNLPNEPAVPLPKGAGEDTLSPSDRATVESILVAARAEAEQGDETACFERLEEARRVAQGGGS